MFFQIKFVKKLTQIKYQACFYMIKEKYINSEKKNNYLIEKNNKFKNFNKKEMLKEKVLKTSIQMKITKVLKNFYKITSKALLWNYNLNQIYIN